MAETLQKGWLYTREGDKFAPATLIESIYDRKGKQYLETLQSYFDSHEDLSDSVEHLSESTDNRFSQINTKLNELIGKDEEFQDIFQYFNGVGDDALYIIDENSNVIAYIDHTGVNSIDFTIPDTGISLQKVHSELNDVNDVVEALVEKTESFDGTPDDTFFFIDASKNVVAYIDRDGIHATNFLTDENDFNEYGRWIE